MADGLDHLVVDGNEVLEMKLGELTFSYHCFTFILFVILIHFFYS